MSLSGISIKVSVYLLTSPIFCDYKPWSPVNVESWPGCPAVADLGKKVSRYRWIPSIGPPSVLLGATIPWSTVNIWTRLKPARQKKQ